MSLFLDARIPVVIAAMPEAGGDAAILAEAPAGSPGEAGTAGGPGEAGSAGGSGRAGSAGASGKAGSAGGAHATFSVAEAPHPAGCACCLPRSEAAAALGRLFLARARGDVAFFRRVVAVTMTPQGEAAVRAAVAEDPLISGRFRLG